MNIELLKRIYLGLSGSWIILFMPTSTYNQEKAETNAIRWLNKLADFTSDEDDDVKMLAWDAREAIANFSLEALDELMKQIAELGIRYGQDFDRMSD